MAVLVRTVQRLLTRPTELGVRVLLVRGDEVALVRHRGGAHPWGLPGGGVKMGEALEAAALREVREEAGCLVRIERLHGVFYSYEQRFKNYIVVFVGTPLGDLRPPVDDLEIAAARYVAMADLPAGVDPGSRRRVSEYLRGESGLARAW